MKNVDEYITSKGAKIGIGELADTIVNLMGGGAEVHIDGRDQDGLLVRWVYTDVTFHLAYVSKRFALYDLGAYAVQKIEVEDEVSD